MCVCVCVSFRATVTDEGRVHELEKGGTFLLRVEGRTIVCGGRGRKHGLLSSRW